MLQCQQEDPRMGNHPIMWDLHIIMWVPHISYPWISHLGSRMKCSVYMDRDWFVTPNAPTGIGWNVPYIYGPWLICNTQFSAHERYCLHYWVNTTSIHSPKAPDSMINGLTKLGITSVRADTIRLLRQILLLLSTQIVPFYGISESSTYHYEKVRC